MKKITQDWKTSGIYCIINISNNKRYIGSSKNLYQRLLKHRSLLRGNKHDNRYLQNAWNKHKEDLFEFFIIEFCNEDILELREQFFINTLKPEYNITLIVERNILSKESRLLQSATRKKRIASGEIKLYGKEIFKYDLRGNFVRGYENIKKACEDTGIHQSTMCRFLNGTTKKAGEHLWSLFKEDKLTPYVKSTAQLDSARNPVQVVDYNTFNIIMEFTSIKECAENFGVISNVIIYNIQRKRKFLDKYMIIYKPA